jgi:hypothetical protein
VKLPKLPKLSLPRFTKFIGIGLVVALVLVGIGYWLNTGSQVRLEGKVLKVRTVPADDNASLAVVDFRVKNTTRTLFQLKTLTLVVTTAEGQVVEGLPVAQVDLDRVLDYHKVLGPRRTEMLKERDRIRVGTEEDCTAAGSFSISERALQSRKSLVIKLQDADGATIEIPETAR